MLQDVTTFGESFGRRFSLHNDDLRSEEGSVLLLQYLHHQNIQNYSVLKAVSQLVITQLSSGRIIYTARKLSVFGVILVRILVSLRIQFECEKIRTITPNTDTFYAVLGSDFNASVSQMKFKYFYQCYFIRCDRRKNSLQKMSGLALRTSCKTNFFNLQRQLTTEVFLKIFCQINIYFLNNILKKLLIRRMLLFQSSQWQRFS